MLRISQKTSGSDTAKYFFGYYAEQELDNPKWLGKGSEKLGLNGPITEKELESICNNINPKTGEQITDRMIQKRTSNYDLTFSIPKSASVIYGITEDKDILTSFDNAVLETMSEIESYSEVRVRQNGAMENRKTENLIYGIFTHGESRPVDGVSDPQLHKHVIVPNLVFDEKEDKWKAGNFRNIKTNAPYFETIFKSRMADELSKIGYDIERKKGDFEIKGFNRNLIEKYSRRTVEIEERAKELGIEYAEDKAALGAKTRDSKITNLDRDEMKKEWESRLTEDEKEIIITAKNSETENQKAILPSEALDYSLSHNLARKSVVSEKELLMTGLKRSFGQVTPEQINKEIESRKDLLSKEDKFGNKLFTTKEALEEEKKLIEASKEGLGQHKSINKQYDIRNKELTTEQANSVKHVLSSKDFITAISGKAGTGKTYSIKEVANGVKETGMSFVAVAPSSEASRTVQRGEGFTNATTIADLLQNEKLQSELKSGMLWVDEASLVGNSTMNNIIDLAKKQEARILLTGDKQHHSVERGDSFRILTQYGGVTPSNINKIQRQKRDDYRKAVTLISDGDVTKGFSRLDDMGAIKESETMEDMYKSAAKEYVESVKNKEQVLVVSTTHVQGKIFTETVRDLMKQEKLISKGERKIVIQKNLNFTDAEKSDHINYSEGQIVQFHQHVKGGIKRGEKYKVSNISEKGDIKISAFNSKDEPKTFDLPKDKLDRFSVYEQQQIKMAKGDIIRINQNGFTQKKERLNNGNLFTVKGFDKEGNIKATTGKREVTIDKDYGNLALGFYNTSPSSQGKTSNKVIILQSSMSGRAANKQQFYVSASRGKFSVSIHTDDKEHLLNSVQRSSDRMTATEIAKGGKSKHQIKENKTKKSTQPELERLKKIQRLNKMKINKQKKVNYGKSGPTK